MKCSAVQSTDKLRIIKKSNKIKQKTFKGIPQRIEYIPVHDWHDAVKCWEFLKSAKYLDVHSDGSYQAYKYIREDNYSFLNKLSSYKDKSAFIEKFCDFTKFPNVKAVSEKIDSTFKNCINFIARELNSCRYGEPYTILDSGYDPTCSIGLGKAFPGSDLDKGYIILKGSDTANDKDIVNNFKGALWNSLDQRIVSLNHPDTFPEVYTKKQVKDKLNELDTIANGIVSRNGASAIIAAAGAVAGDIILGPFGVPLGLLLASRFMGDTEKYEEIKNSSETNPYTAGEFNREVAKRITYSSDREAAKNFAFFIETVEANLTKNSGQKTDSLFDDIRKSPFVRNSNVTQIGAWQRKTNGGYLKSKLKHRDNLMRDFNYMSTEEKYELVKDLVKYSSNDQSSRFSKYFTNDDDIKSRYDSLLNALK